MKEKWPFSCVNMSIDEIHSGCDGQSAGRTLFYWILRTGNKRESERAGPLFEQGVGDFISFYGSCAQ